MRTDGLIPAQRTPKGCPFDHSDPRHRSRCLFPDTNPQAEPPGQVDPADALEFLDQFHRETGAPDPSRRVRVQAEIATTGTYRHTTAELEFGARVAWRNSARCIGRLYWRSLVVRDLRATRAPHEVFRHCVEHLRLADTGGRIRPVISVFAPDEPGRRGPRIRNDQLIRYAGHRGPGGRVVGDPAQVDLTDQARALGWTCGRGPFDVLPLIIDPPTGPPYLAGLPADAVRQVAITHPHKDLEFFDALRLRWHAVPAIANMDLHIGGITYGCAPFNGWYMGTEIGARNLGDVERYNLLPEIASRMRLDTSSERTLWRDRALIELNVAVLHSFAAAGVTITDHHTESARFMAHCTREESAGRQVPGDWSWLVPPISGSATPVFHRYYDTVAACPAFTARGAGCPRSEQHVVR